MNTLNTFLVKAKFFISTYKWVLIPLVIALLFMYFIIVFITSNQQKTTSQNNVSPQSQISISPSEQPEISPQNRLYGLDNAVQSIAFGKQSSTGGNTNEEHGSNNEFSDMSISQKTFSDGSIEYEYQSDDLQRPHMQLVKNDVVLFLRNLMPDNITTDYYSSYLKNPEYTSQGSNYYGQNAMIYASPTSGIAIVFDQQTNRVYEQYLFPALSVDSYIKKYGSDISAFSPGP